MSRGNAERLVTEPRTRHARGVALHLFRVTLLLAIIGLIHRQHIWLRAQQNGSRAGAVSIDQLSTFFPAASRLDRWDPQHGGQIVKDSQGRSLGYVLQTSPIGDSVVGFSGPTNTLIAFNDHGRILGLTILDSGDTVEHVALVASDCQFMDQFTGLTWEEARRKEPVDAVSGATLTSLAMVAGIGARLGSTRPSIRFPRDLVVEEVRQALPTATRLATSATRPWLRDVFDVQDRKIGSAFRTSPAADHVIGYQGPSDVLVVLNADARVADVVVRSSYDNEPYVRYVREDKYFRSLFEGMTLDALGALDPVEAEIEGVSGATMTSMAIANALPKSARLAGSEREVRQMSNWTLHDFGTLMVLAVAALASFSHIKGSRFVRVVFRIALVLYIGFINVSMLSQALLVGWAQNGIPWRVAPGLVALCAAALFVPVVSKRNLYCHHLCPYGAAQQLIRLRLSRKARLPKWLKGGLKMLPASLLLLGLATAMLHWPVDLTGVEPFGAFDFRLACVATLVVATVGLLASAFFPMAYCRFGCPTGALLRFLRYHGQSCRWTRRDLFAVALLVFAIVVSVPPG